MQTNNNATWLFITPSPHYHNSESFWSSVFSLCVLAESRGNRSLMLPAYQYMEESNRWWFQPDGKLEVPNGLDFTDVVVEGKIRPRFLPRIGPEVPSELLDLRPDVLFRRENRVVMVEVKTVGAELDRYQFACYRQLAEFLRSVGYTTELYFLISAGHEAKGDYPILRKDPAQQELFKVLLWEKVLQQICAADPPSPLSVCLGNISQYYLDEEGYMHGQK